MIPQEPIIKTDKIIKNIGISSCDGEFQSLDGAYTKNSSNREIRKIGVIPISKCQASS